MVLATVNGLDLLLIGVGLVLLAWIVLTYDPKKDHELEDEGPFDITITCSTREEQEELFYYLVKEVESGGLPYDATVHMELGSNYGMPMSKQPVNPEIAQAARVDEYRDEEVTATGVFDDTTAGTIKGGGTPGEVVG